MWAIIAAAIAALLFFLLDKNAAGYHTLWGCLLWAWVTAVAAGILGYAPPLPARRPEA